MDGDLEPGYVVVTVKVPSPSGHKVQVSQPDVSLYEPKSQGAHAVQFLADSNPAGHPSKRNGQYPVTCIRHNNKNADMTMSQYEKLAKPDSQKVFVIH